jgi:hypothetical protein
MTGKWWEILCLATNTTRIAIHQAVQARRPRRGEHRVEARDVGGGPAAAAAASASDRRNSRGRSARRSHPIPSHQAASKIASRNCHMERHTACNTVTNCAPISA